MGGDSQLRMAIVGCGAVAQDGYLPVCSSISDVRVTHVVDVNEQRARNVAREFDVPDFATDHCEILEQVDAIIVTTPPKYHASIARDCLERGVHVLTEKPVATSPAEAAETIAVAEQRGLHYAVARPRRHFPSLYLIKQVLDNGFAGDVCRFEIEEGRKLDWNFRSGYRFDSDLSWGGVLADMGPHMLDVLQWYFGDSAAVENYDDDSLGGIEANADLSLSFDGPRSVTGTAKFSHTRQLDNRVEITTERGHLVASLGHPDHDQSVESVRFYPASDEAGAVGEQEGYVDVTAEDLPGCSTDWGTRLRLQVEAFTEAIHGGEPTYAPAESGRLVVNLIADCYGQQDVTPHSWERDRGVELTADGGEGGDRPDRGDGRSRADGGDGPDE